ncbi:MAG: DUF2255 family protein [Chloroflexi bacterium]|nr:DUF2255 family protein [Chloroflexota bacterium]
MSTWTNAELDKVGAADELELTTLPTDGSAGKLVTVWVVRNGDNLFIRSWKGPGAAWFRRAQAHHKGHIRAGGVDKDVTFVNADRSIDEQIDAAYRAKYTPIEASYVEPMVSPQVRATTLQLVPAPEGGERN